MYETEWMGATFKHWKVDFRVAKCTLIISSWFELPKNHIEDKFFFWYLQITLFCFPKLILDFLCPPIGVRFYC